MGIVRNVKKARVDEEKVKSATIEYEELVDRAYRQFITGLVDAGKKQGVSRLELLRSITNMLTENGWSGHDIGVVLQSVKEQMNSIHYN